MRPCFTPGDRVKVRAQGTTAHSRTPYYLRGKRGVVARLLGAFPNPEQLAYHKLGIPHQPLYQIAFDYSEVWDRRENKTVITADIYQHWLEAD